MTVEMNFHGPVHGVTPNLRNQTIIVLSEKEERKAFEEWYVLNAFDYEKNPIGSGECGKQWRAWLARSKQPISIEK